MGYKHSRLVATTDLPFYWISTVYLPVTVEEWKATESHDFEAPMDGRYETIVFARKLNGDVDMSDDRYVTINYNQDLAFKDHQLLVNDAREGAFD
jgi:hypothetical protein